MNFCQQKLDLIDCHEVYYLVQSVLFLAMV